MELITSVNQGNIPEIKRLIKEGYSLNHKNEVGETALMIAIRRLQPGDIIDPIMAEIFDILISAGASVNIKNINGDSALFYLAMFTLNCIDQLHELLKAGADINIQNNDNMTPLMLISFTWNIFYMNAFISLGASVNLQNIEGDTALMLFYKSFEPLEIDDILISAGTDVNIKNNKGQTALMILLEYYNSDAFAESNNDSRSIYNSVKKLIKAGADINTTDNERNTPLMLAAIRSNKTILLFLLENKAKVNIYNIHGDTAYNMSDDRGKDILLRHRHNVDTRPADLILNKHEELKTKKHIITGNAQHDLLDAFYKLGKDLLFGKRKSVRKNKRKNKKSKKIKK